MEGAKQQGIWRDGLDSNRELFTELDAEFAKKYANLAKSE